MSRERWIILPLVAGLLYLGLTIHAAWLETPTADEFAHVPAGCAAWQQGRFDLYSKNPPLLKLWMTLPLTVDPRVEVPELRTSPLGWGPWIYGLQFMNANRARYLSLFFRARLMVVGLGLLTALLLYGWARELFGRAAAAVCTTLFLLCPNVLAHAHLATIDVGAMFAVLLSLVTFRRALRGTRGARYVFAGVAFGLALAIKFTALLLIPLYTLLAVLELGLAARRGRRGAGRAASWGLPAFALTSLLTIHASFGFQGSLRPVGEFRLASSFAQSLQQRLPAALPVALPADYVLGFDAQKQDTESGEFGSYLMGRWSRDGWWYYNLVALGVKLPLPVLLLLLAAPVAWWRLRVEPLDAAWVCLPVMLLLTVLAVWNRLDIGIRYLLPVFPLLFLSSGPALRWLLEPGGRGWRRAAGLAPVAFGLVTVLAVHPGYLAYFNLLAGGSRNGDAWLIDSNLDWGQDLYRVPDAARRLGAEEPVRVLYFGHVDPGIYRMRYDLVPAHPVEGVLAVSVNYWRGLPFVMTLPDGRFVPVRPDRIEWLRPFEPVERLGSILIFDTRGRLDETGGAADPRRPT